MKDSIVLKKGSDLQNDLYVKLNDFSKTNKTMGRFCSLPVSVVDVALNTLRLPLASIEYIALFAINLIGAAFSKQCTLKDALYCTELAIQAAVSTPIKLLMAPLKIVFQFFAIIIDPETVQSVEWSKPTFKTN